MLLFDQKTTHPSYALLARPKAYSRLRVAPMALRFVAACLAAAPLLAAATTTAGLPAFPGAEGGGALAVGGRGGVVCKVTNLNDSGSGSLRSCIDKEGPRTVIFEVGGTIELNSRIILSNPYITIAGQTAPGGGIQVKAAKNGYGGGDLLTVQTHDVVIRYLRFRKGYTNQKAGNIRLTSAHDVIVDHVSMAWGENQNWTPRGWGGGPSNITLQNSMIVEMLDRRPNFLMGSNTGDNAAAMLNLDHHNNFIANASHRNPSAQNASGRFVNNIFYNWATWASRSIGGVHHDWISNLWKPGPEPKGSRAQQELHFIIWTENYQDPERIIQGDPSLYVAGNRGLQSGMNPGEDNWLYTREAGPTANSGVIGPTPLGWRRHEPLPDTPIPITVRHVDEIEAHILPIVGASKRLDCQGNWVPNRDSADERVVEEYLNNQGTLTESGQGEEVYGGYPALAPGTPCKDSSGDGIPDKWATANDLDPMDPTLGTTVHDNGYTYLELYLNGMQMGLVGPDRPINVNVK